MPADPSPAISGEEKSDCLMQMISACVRVLCMHLMSREQQHQQQQQQQQQATAKAICEVIGSTASGLLKELVKLSVQLTLRDFRNQLEQGLGQTGDGNRDLGRLVGGKRAY